MAGELNWTNPAAVLQAGRTVVSLLTCGAGPTWAFAPKGPYAAGTTYAAGDVVTSAGIPYRSIQAGNVGHTPKTSPAYWRPLFVTQLQQFNAKGTYAAGDLVTYGTSSVAGIAYVALNAVDGSGANTALTDPTTDTTNWAALPSANGKIGLDLVELDSVVCHVELAAGETFGASAVIQYYLLDPATGQINRAPGLENDVALTSGGVGQSLAGFRIDGPIGALIAIPYNLGSVNPKVVLTGHRRARIFSA